MDRSLVGHTLFAVAAAVAAYAAWGTPRASRDASVVVIPGAPERLTQVVWHEEKWGVTLSREGEQVDVTVVKNQPPASAASAPDPTVAAAPSTGAGPKTYPGSKKADETFAELAPLRAARDLGKPDAAKLETLGLDKPASSLTLRYGDNEQLVQIGNATFGSGDLYARRADGNVFLLPASAISGLRHGATGLIDRTAIGVPRSDIELLAITAGERSREIIQRYPEEERKAFFADPAEPDHKLELVSNWLDRVLRLRMIDTVDEIPTGLPALAVELFNGNESRGVLKLWPAGDKTALATSTRFRHAITVSKANAEAILKDLDAVLSEGR